MKTTRRRIPLGPRKLWAALFAIAGTAIFALTNPTPTQWIIFVGLMVGLTVTSYLVIDLKRSVHAQARSLRRGLRQVSRTLNTNRPAPAPIRESLPSPQKTPKIEPQVVHDVGRAQERLWFGFTSRALSVLANASIDRSADSATRSRAFLERAIWHAANAEWELALEISQLARVADPTPNDRQVALEVDCLIATDDTSAAQRLLDAQTIIPAHGPAFHLRKANTYFTGIGDPAKFEHDGQRLSHLNHLYREERLTPLAPIRPGAPLTIDNLRGASSDGEVTGEKISVLMPAHNAESTLEYAAWSILNQSWKSLELIIIDDGSTDRTASIARVIADADSRVKLLGLVSSKGPYSARNAGLREAEGSLITVHGSGDWAHPEKIQKQVEHWRASSHARASVSYHARVDRNLNFLNPTQRHRVEIVDRNLSSLMIERAVFGEVGSWDEVRAAGDSEFVGRLRAFYGRKAIVDAHSTAPLSLSLSTPSSLTRDALTGSASTNHVLGARRQYRAAFRNWHRSAHFRESLPLKPEGDPNAPFLRPKVLTSQREALAEPEHFDVILVSNLSLPGGTTASNVQEIRAQKRAGMKTGLIHHPVYDWGASRPPNPKVLEEVDGESVRLLSLGERVSCDVLVVRLPKAIETLLDEWPAIDAEKVIVLANQTPDRYYRADGVRVKAYDPKKCTEGLRQKLGQDPIWYPIGPRVRRALAEWHQHELDPSLVAETDWVNIIDPLEWRRPGRRTTEGPFRIGRHSRDSDVKWPTDAKVLRDAYPESAEFQIAVLGGASIPEKALGGLPANWEVYPFDSVKPQEFLAGLDVYVYFTPPGMIEAFGRGLLEALAVGVPLVTSSEFEELFGDAAIYAEPHMVAEIARKLRDDSKYYEEQVQRGYALIEREFSYDAHIRRVRGLSGARV